MKPQVHDIFDLVDHLVGHASTMKSPKTMKTVPIMVRKLRMEENFAVEFLLPGAEIENVGLTVHKGVLKVTHEPGEEQNAASEVFTEFQVGKAERSVVLPDDVDVEVESAKLHQGILKVVFGLKKEERPIMITVE